MQKLVIFDGMVAYNEDSALLYNVGETEKRVNLYAPTNKCLALLIENRSEVISQNVFFTRVWESNGLSITANTFYQHIAMLRRAFEDVGLEKEVIVTIPRRGLTLSGEISITFENTVDVIEMTPDKIVSDSNDDTSITSHTFQTSYYKTRSFLIYISFGLLFFVISFYFAQLLLSEKNHSKTLLDTYEHVGSVERCEIFVYSPFSTLKEVEVKIKEDNIDCASNKIIYYSSVPILNRTSLIACSEKNNERETCLSYFYITSR